jgi:hypothetical protein
MTDGPSTDTSTLTSTITDDTPLTESSSPPLEPPAAAAVATADPEPEPNLPTVPIPVHYVARIRELLDVIPSTERAVIDQIRALLPKVL